MTAIKKPAAPVSVFNLPKQAKAKSPAKPTSTEHLVVEHNTPLPKARLVVGKYDHLFKAMKPGSAIRCEWAEYPHVAQALRQHLKAGKWPALAGCTVKGVRRCPDGHARVWAMLDETKKK